MNFYSDDSTEVGRPTLVQPPQNLGDPREREQYDPGRRAMSTALWSLVSVMVAPALAPLIAFSAIRRALAAMEDFGSGIRCASALGIGVTSAMCALLFWLLWAMLRPTPQALALGWVGLRRLPAVPIGFHQSAADPFGFTPGSFQLPHIR
jgi:hypothetical protein